MCLACDYIVAKFPRVGKAFSCSENVEYRSDRPQKICAREVWTGREFLPNNLEILFEYIETHLDEIIYKPAHKISPELVHYRRLKSTFKGCAWQRPREYIQIYIDSGIVEINMLHGRSAEADLIDDYLHWIEFYREQARKAVLCLPQPIAEEIIPQL